MRKLTKQFIKACLYLLVITAFIGVKAQNAPNDVFSYNYTIQNDAVTSNNILEFDLYLLDLDAVQPFEEATVQAGILVNPAIYNGGTITATIVAGSSQLNASQQPTSVTFTQSANVIKLASKAPPGIGNGTIISTVAPGTRVCRIRLTNSVPFTACSQANLAFNFLNLPYPTKVSIYTGGLNTPCPIDATYAFSTATNVGLNCAPPAIFNVTGGGAYCQGGTGLSIGLDGSELGVTYSLLLGGSPMVPPVSQVGTGSALTFNNLLAGTYTISATGPGGTVLMTGSAIITETPNTPVSVTILEDANNVCSGTTVNFTATPTNGGVTPTYQWFVNGSAQGAGLATYAYVPLNGDLVSVTMTTSLTGCLSGNPAISNVITMNVVASGPASVIIAASSNPSCGAASVTFTATPTNGGTPTYQWYLNTVAVGTNLATYSYVPVTGDVVYVDMTSSLTCVIGSPLVSSNTITMTVDVPVPASVSMSPSADPVCAGTSVTFTAVPTNGGTPTYQWYVNSAIVGTNLPTYTYTPANGDQVYVMMTSGLSCTTGSPATSATTIMTVYALPTPTLAGPASICVNTTSNVYTTEAGFSNYVWLVSAGGSITSGGTAADNTVTVTWNTAGAQTVSVNYTNANNCTAAAATVYNVTVNPLPVPTITGPASACVNSTSNVYTTQTGMTGYVWAITGGTITAGGTPTSNTATVTWNTVGAQSISVNYTNANSCTAVAPTTYNVTVNALPVPTIAGPASVCLNSTGNVYTTEAGMTAYIWTVSAGGTITAGGTATSSSVTVTWTTTGAKTISVNYTNANSCTAPVPTVYNVTVNALPTPTITGPASACINSTGNVYTTQAGNSSYIWSISPGGTITAGAGTSAITVTWNSAGAQSVSVNYSNAAGCIAAAATVYNVTINALPVPTVTGPTPVGVGTSQVYTTQTGMTGYAWTVTGGTITAGAGTNAITVTWNTAGAQTVCVNYINANGCTAVSATCFPVSVISVPPPAGAITGVSSVCQGAMGVPYSVAPIPNATGYVWILPVGATIATGANTNSITVNYSFAAVSGVITVYGTNSYGNGGVSPNFTVTVTTAPVPTITGDNDLCQSSEYFYYVTEPGMTNYVWNISPNSGTITWVTGSNQVMIFWNTPGAHWVSVSYTAPGGCAAAAPTVYNVTVHPLPGAAGAITGTASVCAGTTGVVYSIAAVTNATSYAWTVPAGATIASGATTNSIHVDFGTSAVSGAIIVSAVNNCGPGVASAPFAVTVSALPAAAGAITGPNSVCEGTSGVGYSVGAIANASGYTWTVPAGATIATGANTNSITVNFGTTSGTVTVKGTNTCGDGTSSTLNVAVNPIPSAPVITLSGYLLTSSATVGNTWYLNGTIITGATGQTYTAPHTGNYYCVVTLNGCSSDTSNNIYVLYDNTNELVKVQKVEVYPNPNNGHFTLAITSSAKEAFDLRIVNNLGVTIYDRKNLVVDGTLNEVIDLKNIPNGVYSVILNNQSRQIIRKIVIE
jgi:hypothetical protein